MINPIIYTFHLFGYDIPLRWYGVLVMLGAVVGTWLAEKEINRRGEKGETIWDALVWVLIPGIIGARLWFVANYTLGVDASYIENPIQILYIWKGGLHFFGGLLFGAIALFIYLRQQGLDVWLYLDSIAPATMIGQAIGRLANFINQELYGQPTQLPWGIPISAEHRTVVPYNNLELYPVETTRFHPTFAYEMVLNFIVALFLIWYARQYPKRMKPGAMFGAWLIGAGLARSFIELFRPDQPKIAGTIVSYSMLVSLLMALAGAILLLVRYRKLNFAFAENWEKEYQISGSPVTVKAPSVETARAAQPEKRTRSKASRGSASAKPATKEKKPKPKAKPASPRK